MRKFITGLIFFTLSTWVIGAYAQDPTTVGELLGRGGTQLAKAELVPLLTGATIAGEQHRTEAKFRNLMKPDGTLSGKATLRSGASVDTFGNWRVTDDGAVRSDLGNSGTAGYRQTVNFYFKLGSKFFAALTAEKDADIMERFFER